jgi:hypothetical protein
MKLHISHVVARAQERGYDVESILPCLLADLGDGWFEVDVEHEAYPRARDSEIVPQKRGLGDIVKAGLSAIGITEERVSAVIGRPCGCSQRAEALNELGRKIGIG